MAVKCQWCFEPVVPNVPEEFASKWSLSHGFVSLLNIISNNNDQINIRYRTEL